jgi:hypothetical protein
MVVACRAFLKYVNKHTNSAMGPLSKTSFTQGWEKGLETWMLWYKFIFSKNGEKYS